MPTSARLAAINRIQEIYTKLNKEALVAEELDELVTLTTELQESAIILRYKAAEVRVFEGTKKEVEAPVIEEKEEVKEEIKEEIQEEIKEEVQEEPKELDFTMFDLPQAQEKVVEVEAQVEPEPVVLETTQEEAPVSVTIEQEISVETVKESLSVFEPTEEAIEFEAELEVDTIEIVESTTISISNPDWSSYFEKVLRDKSTGIRTPLSALAGSFGLNERILYINELFNKDAEAFSAFVQKIDAQKEWTICTETLSLEANQRNWDKENDTTGEFILHVSRRYV